MLISDKTDGVQSVFAFDEGELLQKIAEYYKDFTFSPGEREMIDRYNAHWLYYK